MNRVIHFRRKIKEAAAAIVESSYFYAIRATTPESRALQIQTLVTKLTVNLEYIFPLEVYSRSSVDSGSDISFVQFHHQERDDGADGTILTFTRVKSEPYLHPAIISILRTQIFSGSRVAPGLIYEDSFVSSVELDSDKEVPKPMMCIVALAVCFSFTLLCL